MSKSESTNHERTRSQWLGHHPAVVVGLAVLVAGGAYLGVRWLDSETGGNPNILGLRSAPAGVGPGRAPRRPISAVIDELENVTIPRDQILDGGPGKDGIPSISKPQFVSAAEADFLQPDSRVIGIETGAKPRCYPLAILNYHECVNDEIGGVPIAVTYCPLCDSSLVFDRRVGERTVEFGISGLLYNSNVLLYDRGADELESLWSQMKSEAVSGDASSAELATIPFEMTTWSDWQSRHPETEVLSTETGFTRDYSHNPYAGYFAEGDFYFPADQLPTGGTPGMRDRILGVWVDDSSRAYPVKEFSSVDEPVTIDEELSGKTFRIRYEPEHQTLRVLDRDDGVNHAYSLWFAWYAFRPETEVFEYTPAD